MHAEALSGRVVDLIDGATLPTITPAALLGALALLLAGAGLVTLQGLGGGDGPPLLVALPLPRVEASICVVPALSRPDDDLVRRLRGYADHPAVDAIVVVSPPGHPPVPRRIGGLPVRAATVVVGTPSDTVQGERDV